MLALAPFSVWKRKVSTCDPLHQAFPTGRGLSSRVVLDVWIQHEMSHIYLYYFTIFFQISDVINHVTLHVSHRHWSRSEVWSSIGWDQKHEPIRKRCECGCETTSPHDFTLFLNFLSRKRTATCPVCIKTIESNLLTRPCLLHRYRLFLWFYMLKHTNIMHKLFNCYKQIVEKNHELCHLFLVFCPVPKPQNFDSSFALDRNSHWPDITQSDMVCRPLLEMFYRTQ